MPEAILEYLQRHLDLEEESEKLLPLQAEFYSRIASYTRDLRRTIASANSEVTNRLISRQLGLIDGMVRRFVTLRMRKAVSQSAIPQLLPEERHVCSIEADFRLQVETFVESVSAGRLSFLETAHHDEMGRSTVVRFTKDVTEIVGLDMRRYGPFKPNDLASVPAANAEIFVANGEAVTVSARKDS